MPRFAREACGFCRVVFGIQRLCQSENDNRLNPHEKSQSLVLQGLWDFLCGIFLMEKWISAEELGGSRVNGLVCMRAWDPRPRARGAGGARLPTPAHV